MIFGDDLQHARRSLEDTVVLTKDFIPVHIIYMDGFRNVSVKDLLTSCEDNVKLDDLDLCTSVSLGFVNQRGRVLLASRRPSRQYRAGINGNNTLLSDPFYHRERGSVYTKPFANLMVNNYPPLEECISLLESGLIAGMAISKNYCVTEGGVVYRRNVAVGRVEDSGVKLDDDFSFLKEELEEILNENS